MWSSSAGRWTPVRVPKALIRVQKKVTLKIDAWSAGRWNAACIVYACGSGVGGAVELRGQWPAAATQAKPGLLLYTTKIFLWRRGHRHAIGPRAVLCRWTAGIQNSWEAEGGQVRGRVGGASTYTSCTYIIAMRPMPAALLGCSASSKLQIIAKSTP